MRILVTGVSGFVGGALGRYLQEACGFEVYGLSRSEGRPGSCGSFRSADLSLSVPFDLGRFDAVVHAAGLVTPWAHPEAYERHNVRATANLLAFAKRSGAEQFIYISSSSVFYREGDQFGISEATPFPDIPINAYAATKRRAEELVATSGLKTTILRPRAVFGEGDTVLFPRILRAARLGLLPRFSRPDGARVIGDLVSIDNLVHFVQAALERGAEGDFNLTDDAPVDVYELLEAVLADFDLPAPKLSLPAPLVMRVAGSLEFLSARLFGWREPPLTRFGVSVLSQSKTFDIAKAKAGLGAPVIPTGEALARFVAWQKARR